MSSTRQPPMGTPQLGTHAGLTPQMSIVDANGRPTMFFFRWLLTIGGAALTSDDLSIIESFDPGADTALAESAIADALAAAQLAAGFDDGGAARADLIGRLEDALLAGALRGEGWPPGPDADQRALEALMMADAPPTPATPITFLADTLANWTLANYNPANYTNGQPFLVTTWDVTYTDLAGVWTYTSGVYIAPAASRPATAFNGAALGANDAGLRFLASDTLAASYWNGAAWIAWPAVSSPITVTPMTPVITVGGSSAGITFTSLAANVTRTGTGPGSPITAHVQIAITAWPASPAGAVSIGTFPPSALRASGTVLATAGFVGLTPGASIIPNMAGATGIVTLTTMGATGTTNLPATAIAVGSTFILTLNYLSA